MSHEPQISFTIQLDGTINPIDESPESIERIYQEIYLPAVEVYRKKLNDPEIDLMEESVELAVVYASTSSGRRKRKVRPAGGQLQIVMPKHHEIWVGAMMSASNPNKADTATLQLSSRGRTIRIERTRFTIETRSLEARYIRTWKYGDEGVLSTWSRTSVTRQTTEPLLTLSQNAREGYTQLRHRIFSRATSEDAIQPDETGVFQVMANIMELCEKNRYGGLKSPDPHPSKKLLNAAAAAFTILSAESGMFAIAGGYEQLGVEPGFVGHDQFIVSQFATIMVWFGIDTYFTSALSSGAFHAPKTGLAIDLYQSDMYVFDMIRDEIPKVYAKYVD